MTFAQRIATLAIHGQFNNPDFKVDEFINRKKFFKSKYEEEIYFKKQIKKKKYYEELDAQEEKESY